MEGSVSTCSLRAVAWEVYTRGAYPATFKAEGCCLCCSARSASLWWYSHSIVMKFYRRFEVRFASHYYGRRQCLTKTDNLCHIQRRSYEAVIYSLTVYRHDPITVLSSGHFSTLSSTNLQSFRCKRYNDHACHIPRHNSRPRPPGGGGMKGM